MNIAPSTAPLRKNFPKVSNPGNAPVSKSVVRQMIKSSLGSQQELKYYSTFINTTLDISGTIFSILRPAQGVSDLDRIGDSVFLKHIELKYATSAADPTNLVRVIVFKWNQASTPTVADVLTSAYLGTVQAPLAPLTWDNRSKITVYYDKLHSLVPSTNTALVSSSLSLPIKGRVQWAASAVTNGTNQIYICAISDSGAATHPAFEFVSLVAFSDD